MKLFVRLFLLLILFSCSEYDINRKPAFTDQYIASNAGIYSIDIPPAYEIAHFIMLLEDRNMDYSSFIRKDTPYYNEVGDLLSSHLDHKLISKLDLVSDEGLTNDYFTEHFAFRNNSYVFELDENELVDKGLYGRFSSSRHFIKNIDLINKFIEDTEAVKFIQDHKSFYQDEIAKYESVIDVRKMWDWLESKFPMRIDHYKVIFSPLTDASHNTMRFSSDDGSYTEILLFVSGIQRPLNEITESRKAGHERVIFTEIDHNYVNPVTDEYIDELESVMTNLDKWSSNSFYEGPYRIFNEYMTWSVFCLYLKEFYDDDTYLLVKDAVEDQMVKSRSFLLFKDFNNELIRLYSDHPEDIAALYPMMLDWIKENDQ